MRKHHGVTVSEIVGKPTQDLVDLHLAAFRGYMNARLGPRYVGAFLNWFASEPDSIALAAHSGGRSVGFAVGAPHGYQASMIRSLLPSAAAAFLLRPNLWPDLHIWSTSVRKVIGALFSGETPTPSGVETLIGYSLVAIAVHPDFHRQGIGGMLIDRFTAACRLRGANLVTLTVYRENEAARATYERQGWTLCDEPSGTSKLVFQRQL